MRRNYPSFLKNEPLIWGITLSDIFKMTAVMFVLSILNVPQSWIIGLIAVFYLGLITVRRLYPKRYFEFKWKQKKKIESYGMISTLGEINK